MKEEDCDMTLVYAIKKNEQMGYEKLWTNGDERISFKYPETVHNHYQHIYDVESHNAMY